MKGLDSMSFTDDYKKIEEAERTKLRELTIKLISKENSRTVNLNSSLGLVTSYIVTKLSLYGQIKNTTRAQIETETGITEKSWVNKILNNLEKQGYIKRYKKVNKTILVRKNIVKYTYDKYEFTILITGKLIKEIENIGESVSFDKSQLTVFYRNAIKDTYKVNKYPKQKDDINYTEEVVTKADGKRIKTTHVDMESVKDAKKKAKDEYNEKLNNINEIASKNGLEEELSSVKPLVTQKELKLVNTPEQKRRQIKESINEDGEESPSRVNVSKRNIVRDDDLGIISPDRRAGFKSPQIDLEFLDGEELEIID